MSFPKILHQLQEEIIFPRELKRFRYEEVTNLNVLSEQKICGFEKSDIVKFFRYRCTYAQYLPLVNTHSTYASTDYDNNNVDGDNDYYDDNNDNHKLLCR